ncbi:MAG: translation elongation factor Ts [Candidatus Peribacteria bacterium]|nr:MAG: translation elongation factor Ts [Candidatus Peribacteria bacterium]
MALLKQLRNQTHAPLKDCKEALEESGGDLAVAEKIMREKGALKAEKKADRETNEGVVWVLQEGNKVAGVKLACETDFVAKNDTFRGLAQQLAQRLITLAPFGELAGLDPQVREELDNVLKESFVTIGENMQILDAFVAEGTTYVYRHPGDKVAAVVFYTGDEQRAKEAALQVAAMDPTYLTVDEVPAAHVEELSALYRKELQDSGKPADIVEKILQ